jgi:hypothetical protein
MLDHLQQPPPSRDVACVSLACLDLNGGDDCLNTVFEFLRYASAFFLSITEKDLRDVWK